MRLYIFCSGIFCLMKAHVMKGIFLPQVFCKLDYSVHPNFSLFLFSRLLRITDKSLTYILYIHTHTYAHFTKTRISSLEYSFDIWTMTSQIFI